MTVSAKLGLDLALERGEVLLSSFYERNRGNDHFFYVIDFNKWLPSDPMAGSTDWTRKPLSGLEICSRLCILVTEDSLNLTVF